MISSIHNHNVMETFLLPYAQRVSVEIVKEDADYREQYFRSSPAMTWKRKYSMKLERIRLIMLLQKENTSFESQRRVKRWPHSLPYNFQGSFPNGDSIERYTNIINITFWNVNKKTGNHKTNWDKYLEMIICINMSIRSQGKQTSQFGMREIILILAAVLLHTRKNTQYNTQNTNATKNKHLGPRDIRMILAAVPFQMGTSIFSWVPSGPDTVISCKKTKQYIFHFYEATYYKEKTINTFVFEVMASMEHIKISATMKTATKLWMK